MTKLLEISFRRRSSCRPRALTRRLGRGTRRLRSGLRSALRSRLHSRLRSRLRRTVRSSQPRCDKAALFLSLLDAIVRLSRPTRTARRVCNVLPRVRNNPSKSLPNGLRPERIPRWFKQLLGCCNTLASALAPPADGVLPARDLYRLHS